MRLSVFRDALRTTFGIGWKRSFGPSFCPLVRVHRTNFLRSAAFDVCFGMITYVKVEIGYARGWLLAGFTIEMPPLSGATRLMVWAAAAMPFSPGRANTPALFWMAANLKWLTSEKATST